jgi:hypothetical protein
MAIQTPSGVPESVTVIAGFSLGIVGNAARDMGVFGRMNDYHT